MKKAALIVGSGFAYSQPELQQLDTIETPWGATSSPLMNMRIGELEVAVLARHGLSHEWAPHAVNYRANMWALRELGIGHCFAFNVVGGIRADLVPGVLAVPDQLIDYTWGRESSFGARDGGVLHTELTQPFSSLMREMLDQAVRERQLPLIDGTYGVTQGPRLETAAEIDRLERDGCAMVGMTAMPEAVLAREAGIEYAILAGVVNHAAGRGPVGHSIHAEMAEIATSLSSAAWRVLSAALRHLADRNL